MKTIRLKNKFVLGLGALALTFGGFASLSSNSTRTISRSASNSNFLVKNFQGLESTYNYSAYYPTCPTGYRWYPYPVSRCLKNSVAPPVFSVEKEWDDIKRRLTQAEKDAEEIDKMLDKTDEIIKRIFKNVEGKREKN